MAELALAAVLLILVPAALLADLFRARHPTRGQWMLSAGLAGAYLLFVTLTGRWEHFSVHLPWVLLVLLVLALYLPSRRDAAAQGSIRKGAPVPAMTLLALGLTGFGAASGVAYAARGGPGPEELPSLVFPLERGVYFVTEGGGSALINAHRRGDPSEAWAVDIVKLNRRGAHARGFAPRDPAGHEIFGEPVHAPCAGRVTAAVDGHPDAGGSGRGADGAAREGSAREAAEAAGNYVALDCAAGRVVLAHLREGSVRVAAGEELRVGDALAEVGSSGRAQRPHLHVHVEREGAADGLGEREGVPVRFEGRFLVRGQRFRVEAGPGDR